MLAAPEGGTGTTRSTRIATIDSARPTPVPTPTSAATSRPTDQTTCRLRAPSAMRMPISRERRATAKATTA